MFYDSLEIVEIPTRPSTASLIPTSNLRMSTPEDLVPRFQLERLLNQGKATNSSTGLRLSLQNI